MCSGHGSRCRKVRTAKARAAKPAQGRPIGYLAAWLAQHAATQDEHKHIPLPSFEARLAARQVVQDLPGARAALLDFERVVREGEGIEPTGYP